MTDARRRAEHDGDFILLGEFKGRLYHILGLCRTRRIGGPGSWRTARRSGCPVPVCELWGPGSSATSTTNPPLDAQIGGTHEGIGRHIQPDLLHRHCGALAGVTVGQCRFVGYFFIDRPFEVHPGFGFPWRIQQLPSGSPKRGFPDRRRRKSQSFSMRPLPIASLPIRILSSLSVIVFSLQNEKGRGFQPIRGLVNDF